MARVKKQFYGPSLPFHANLSQHGSVLWSHDEDRGFRLSGEVYLGDSPPDWRFAIREGRDASSEMIGKKWEHSHTPLYYRHYGLKGPVWGHDWVAHGAAHPQLDDVIAPGLIPQSRAQNIAAGAILNDYKDAVQTFGGLNFAAEAVETISLFTNPLKGMLNKTIGYARYVGSVKKYALRAPTTYADKIGKAWLAYKFGIEPLANDLASAAFAANQLITGKLAERNTVTIRGKGLSVENFDLGYSKVTDAYAPYAEQELWATLSSEVRYKGKVRPLVSVPVDWASIVGVELSDIVPAIWEAIPFSFLIDYFTNCSEVLSRVSYGNATPYLSYVTCGVRNTMEVAGRDYKFRTNHPDVVDGYVDGVCAGGSFFTRCVEVHRSSGVELPPVTLNFEVPGRSQVLNVAALVAAVRNSKP